MGLISVVDIDQDEFCINCMEWREYDEDGRCKVCGKLIKTKNKKYVRDSYTEYDAETFKSESETDEY